MKLRVLILCLMVINGLFSQEIDESCLPLDKKIQKIIDRASIETDPRLATDLFNSAIEQAPENVAPYYAFGVYAYNKADEYYQKYPNPETGDKSLIKAEKLFLQALDLCDKYQADVYYNLGVINYTLDKKDVANQWFQKFS